MRRAEREGRFGVVMIGVAQEKTSAWRGFRRGGSDAHPHFCYRRMSIFPNFYYVYIRDREFGPAFIKTCAYSPWGIWIYLNGHEWAKRQAEKRGIGFEALDNGFRCVEDAAALQAICGTFYWGDIERFWAYWQQRLPSPPPPPIVTVAIATACRSASSRCRTRACPSAPSRFGSGSS
jgi:hypothetical protein